MAFLNLDELPKKAPTTPDEPGYFMPGSKTEAAARGFANAATFGMAPRISAGVNSLINGNSFGQTLKDYLNADKAAQAAHPGVTLAAGAVPNLIQAAATGGGSLARQAGVNAAMGAVNAAGNSDNQGGDLLKDTLLGGAVGGTLGGAVGGIAKGVTNTANSYAKNVAKNNLENLITNKPPGWKTMLEKIIGDSSANLKNEGTSLVQEGKHALTAFDELPVNQFGHVAKEAVKSGSTPLGTLTKEAAVAVGKGAVGAATAAGVNYAAGNPLSTGTAAMLGGGLGAHKAVGKFMGDTVKTAANKIALSDVPDYLAKAGTSKLAGGANQLMAQATTKDISDSTNQPSSPFGTLSSYLSQASSATNPAVHAVAQQADGGIQDLDQLPQDTKRKISMELQNTPEGRAISNSTSGIRDLDAELN